MAFTKADISVMYKVIKHGLKMQDVRAQYSAQKMTEMRYCLLQCAIADSAAKGDAAVASDSGTASP